MSSVLLLMGGFKPIILLLQARNFLIQVLNPHHTSYLRELGRFKAFCSFKARDMTSTSAKHSQGMHRHLHTLLLKHETSILSRHGPGIDSLAIEKQMFNTMQSANIPLINLFHSFFWVLATFVTDDFDNTADKLSCILTSSKDVSCQDQIIRFICSLRRPGPSSTIIYINPNSPAIIQLRQTSHTYY